MEFNNKTASLFTPLFYENTQKNKYFIPFDMISIGISFEFHIGVSQINIKAPKGSNFSYN